MGHPLAFADAVEHGFDRAGKAVGIEAQRTERFAVGHDVRRCLDFDTIEFLLCRSDGFVQHGFDARIGFAVVHAFDGDDANI